MTKSGREENLDCLESHPQAALEAATQSRGGDNAELRGLRVLLDEVDEGHEWGGLKKVLTPEGHYLWLCDGHAEEYRT